MSSLNQKNWLIFLYSQATIAPPIKGKMFKGLCVCYLVIVTTYFSVAISGYWAFGNQAKSVILSNFNAKDATGHNLLPTWFLLLTNASTIAQILAITLVITRRHLSCRDLISIANFHENRSDSCRFIFNRPMNCSRRS